MGSYTRGHLDYPRGSLDYPPREAQHPRREAKRRSPAPMTFPGLCEMLPSPDADEAADDAAEHQGMIVGPNPFQGPPEAIVPCWREDSSDRVLEASDDVDYTLAGYGAKVRA